MAKNELKEFQGDGTQRCEWCLSGVPQLFLHEASDTYWHYGCLMCINESPLFELDLEPSCDPNLIRITMASSAVKEQIFTTQIVVDMCSTEWSSGGW